MADVQTRSYTKYKAQLTKILQSNPETCLILATELNSEDLISFDTLEKARNESGIERALAVLNGVHPKLQTDPDAFGKLVTALDKEGILRSIAAKMQGEGDCVSSAGNVTSDSTAASRALTLPSSEPGGRNPGSWTCNCRHFCCLCVEITCYLSYWYLA